MRKLFFIFIFFNAAMGLYGFTNTHLTNKKTGPVDLEFWDKTFQYGISSQKESVIDYIRQYHLKKGEELLLKHLSGEKNLGIRKDMISALLVFTNKGVVPSLLDIIRNEKDSDLRGLAVMYLGELKGKKYYLQIIDLIDSEDEVLAEKALQSLGQMSVPESVDRLMKKLETEKNDRIRTDLILALSDIRSEKSQDSLISILSNQEEKELNRAYAITGLGYLKNKKSYDVLLRFYPLVNPNLKVRIIDSLGNLENKAAIGVLIEALKDDDKNIRYYSVVALGKLKARESMDILEYKKDYDPDPKVREKVKDVLKELKGTK